jgi:Fur family peroxide stress response transcriptional regulator
MSSDHVSSESSTPPGTPDGAARVGGFDARSILKEKGLRYSRPREAILAFLREKDRHVSAESLYLELKKRGEDLSLSTVYLNLAALTEAGLVCEFKGANGESLYDSNITPHYHVVCKETGEILDVPAPMVDGKPLGLYLKEHIERATGWQVDEPQFSLSGVSPAVRDR